MFRYLTLAVLLSLALAARGQEAKRVAVLGALPPATDAADAEAARRALQAAGLNARIIDARTLEDATRFSPAAYDLLVMPHPETFPAAAQQNLLAYLRGKGRLLCLGGPPFTRYVYQSGDRWRTWQELITELPSTGQIIDIGRTDLRAWTRGAANPASPSAVTREESPHGPALKFSFPNFTEWDNFAAPPFASSPYPPGSDLLIFWAKGDARTDAVVIEWRERDRSRWIASVPVTTEWRRYALAPDAFRYWQDNPSSGRGGAGDHFRPENAMQLTIGLAQSHAPMAPGPKTFWIAGLDATHMPAGAPREEPPILEGLSPWYKIYTTANSGYYPIERFRGVSPLTGPGRLRQFAIAGGGHGWEYHALAGPYNGALWGAWVGPAADMARSARRILNDWQVAHAAPQAVCIRAGAPSAFNASVFDSGRGAVSLTSSLSIVRTGAQNTTPRRIEQTLRLSPGARTDASVPIPSLEPGDYTYTWTFRDGTAAVDDAILGRFTVLPANGLSTERVTVRNGDFLRGDTPWRPVGINYWPLWVSGMDQAEYWQGWLSPEQYDPVLIERDLTQAEQLGMNVMSVQYGKVAMANQLEDFLARCRAHHIYANVFVSGGHPLVELDLERGYDPKPMLALIEAAHLPQNDTVFAYDIAWEPHAGPHADRTRLDAEWDRWILVNYGTIAKAERDWGYAAPRENGKVTNPLDNQLTTDGPWRRMVAAYRRFMDDRISWGYREVTRAIRSVDRVHLIGARSGYGGTGSVWAVPVMAFDLVSGAKHLDFISPEGYGLQGDARSFLGGGGAITAYGRWAGDGKPVFWAEYGQSIYPNTTPAKIEGQGDYYVKVMGMISGSGSNGGAGWWWPGGLRLDENSDFGVINPSGVARPAATVTGHTARELSGKTSALNGPRVVFTFDRDADVRGYAAIWLKTSEPYAAAREKGQVPVMRTAGTGTTTATMPLLAVGDVPADGANPLKYANAEFNRVAKEAIGNGEYRLRASVGNTGEAAWTRNGAGRVALVARIGDRMVGEAPLNQPVARYADGEATIVVRGAPGQTVTLRLAVLGRQQGRIDFGEQVGVRL